ncbi:hypothetical protein FBU30_005404 [Linnemannia zychae]|nr:hypothetical protein FBU30_005404 [Linnemannia zychae]
MKSVLTIILLVIVVSRVAAVVPIPIKECTKTVVVDPKYDTCFDFARDYNITFKDLLQFNEKLRKDCMNLDTGEKMCVSINPDGINPPLTSKTKKKQDPIEPFPKDTNDSKKKTPKAPKERHSKVVQNETTKGSIKASKRKYTSSAAVVPPPTAVTNDVSSDPVTVSSNIKQQDIHTNGVTGSTSSIMLAAAGVLLSVIYLL